MLAEFDSILYALCPGLVQGVQLLARFIQSG